MLIAELYRLFREAGQELSIDSRKIPAGALFFALKGENFDGNVFAGAALEAGASLAIVDDPGLKGKEGCIWVPDVLKSLQELAHYHRKQFTIPVLAITGSNGKTTTKELVHKVLGSHYKCGVTKGNFNNHIGVPLTLLGLEPDIDIAVIEMGANHQGEIANLCKIAAPTHGLITNIGKAHLEGFGGIAGVKKGKGELYGFLADRSGVLFINRDEQHLTEMATSFQRKVFYGLCKTRPQTLYEIQLFREQPFLEFAFADEFGRVQQVVSKLAGRYNLANIVTAVSVGQYFKVPEEKIAAAIAAYEPRNNRSQILERYSNLYILDAYNANPSSMKKALESFATMTCERSKKVAILGDMLELGTYSASEHEGIAETADTLGFDEVFLVGREFAPAAKKLAFRHFFSAAELSAWLKDHPIRESCVLLKASRGIGLEKILE